MTILDQDLVPKCINAGAKCRFVAKSLQDYITAQMATRLMFRSFKQKKRKVTIIRQEFWYDILAQMHNWYIHGSMILWVEGDTYVEGGHDSYPLWALKIDPKQILGLAQKP